MSFLQDMGLWRMFSKMTLQLTLKACDLNSDVNDLFLLSYMFDQAIYVFEMAVFKDMWLFQISKNK